VHTRVLLYHVPRLLGDVLEELLTSPDIEIAGEVGAGESLSTRIEETRADVLILTQERLSDPSATLPLLERHPHLRVLVLVSDARQAYLYELRPTRRQLGTVSLGELVNVIRRGRATEI
jgi:DNA-binding NarL/FixJ family response regulator